MSKNEIPRDFKDLVNRARDMREAGTWNQEEFNKMWDEAVKRVKHHGYPSRSLEGIAIFAEPEWIGMK